MFFDSKDNDRQYGAESFREWCHRFFSNGIVKDENGGYGFSVSSAGGRNVTVSPGVAFINGAIKVMREPVTIEIPEFSGTGSYVVKNIVIEFNTDRDTRDMIVTTDGPASGDANDPVRENSRWQLVIARVRCPDKAERNNVLPEDITDTREDGVLCGFMRCSIDETNISEVANTFRTYMSALGTDEQAKYDAWFANISSKIDQTILDILDDLNAALDTVKQAGTEASSLDGQVTALKERTARFDTEYKSVASAPFIKILASSTSSTNLYDMIKTIKLPATGSISWPNLKKMIITFKWPVEFPYPGTYDNSDQAANGISLTFTKNESGNGLIQDYNLYGSNNSYNYALNTTFLQFSVSISNWQLDDSNSNYVPKYVDVTATQFNTAVSWAYGFDDVPYLKKVLSTGQNYIYTNTNVSNLKIIGIF